MSDGLAKRRGHEGDDRAELISSLIVPVVGGKY